MEVLTENDIDNTPSLFENPRQRLTLRDAVRLCGMSEKTLRRKLEAGLLHGYRENLDYGGFMWMIDARSLSDLYPDSAQLRDYIRLLEVQLNQRSTEADAPPSPPSPAPTAPPPPPAASREPEESEQPEAPAASEPSRRPGGNDFVLYLLEENRCLKEDVREKEVRLRQLQDRTMMLERECGEQRGTASTQARVLEWFQQQPQPALPEGRRAEEPATVTAAPPPRNLRPALLGALAAIVMTWLLLALVRL